MEKKYSNKLVFDYITGNDIVGYDIDYLENDPCFMMQVIERTNDKNMYELCGEDVLKDYDFVRFLVNKFKADIPFICKVADTFLDFYSEDDLHYDCLELNIIMSNIIGYTDDLELARYTISKNALYHSFMLELAILLSEDKKRKECCSDDVELGKGFLVINDMFLGRNIILDFFASKFVDEILYEDEVTFESRVHDDINSFDDILKMGRKNYLIGFLRRYDESLADYLSSHTELLKYDLKSLDRIGYRWDDYVKKEKYRKFKVLEKEVFDFFKDSSLNDPSFSSYDLLDYILIKFNLIDDYRKCFNEDLYSGDEYSEEFKVDLFSKFSSVDRSLTDYQYYKFGFDLAKELFKKNILAKKEESDTKVSMCKVINFEFRRKKG